MYRIKALRAFADINIGDIGGYVEATRNLALFSGDSWIYDDAIVESRAKVSGSAKIKGNAHLMDYATAHGSAEVRGKVVMKEHSCAGREAKIFGNAILAGEAYVTNEAWVYGNAIITDALIAQKSRIYGNVRLTGKIKAFQNTTMRGNADITYCPNDPDAFDEFLVFSNFYNTDVDPMLLLDSDLVVDCSAWGGFVLKKRLEAAVLNG